MHPIREPRTTAPIPDHETPLPGDWRGPEIAERPEAYFVELDAPARNGLRAAADAIERGEASADTEARVHETLAAVTETSRRILSSGDGFVQIRGVPTEGFSRPTLASLFTYIGTALGRPTPQNLEGELVTDIRDTGADPTDRDVRLYRTRAEQDFHTDGADVIGLLCLHPAARGGLSRLVSSVRVFKQVAAQRPDLAPLLVEPWYFHLPGGEERGLPPAIPRPIASYDGKKLESFFIGWYIRNAQGKRGVQPLSKRQEEVLALYESTANDPELYLDMDLRPGDVQWLRNAFVLHKRTAYEDAVPPMPKRHLLRLWLNAPYIDDSTPRFEQMAVLP